MTIGFILSVSIKKIFEAEIIIAYSLAKASYIVMSNFTKVGKGNLPLCKRQENWKYWERALMTSLMAWIRYVTYIIRNLLRKNI